MEIGTEELPARFIEPALKSIYELSPKLLKDLELDWEELKTTGTCRRLTLFIKGLLEKQKDKEEEILGPSVKIGQDEKGNYTPALLGFLKKHSASFENLFIKKTPKGDYFYIKKFIPGKKTFDLLPGFLKELIQNISFPKKMRWSNFNFSFARPIKWLLALYGEEIISFEIAGIKSASYTYGHRFLSSNPIFISSADYETYKETLFKNYVLLELQERINFTQEKIQEITKDIGIPVIDQELLIENVHLVEYPFPILGKFPEKYLNLPEKLVITALQDHQRYFFLRNQEEKLLPYFIAVNNNRGKEEIIIQGDRRVAKARLEDAHFYYERDLKVPLKERVNQLKGIVYYVKAGTLYEKTERLIAIGEFLREKLFPELEKEAVKKACFYAKADLATEVIKEFPSLQGYIGSHYLFLEEEKEIAPALYEQYLPNPKEDFYPETKLGIILSLTDKIDHLCALIGAGERLSGEGDPYGLRRSAYGIIKILLFKKLFLDLEEPINFTLSLLKEQRYFKNPKASEEILTFIRKRLETELQGLDFSKNFIQVVLNQPLNPYLQFLKLKALKEIFVKEDFKDLIILFKRVHQILKPIIDLSILSTLDPSLFQEEAERKLFSKIRELEPSLNRKLKEKDYLKYLETLLQFKPLIDNFFEKVFVMVEEEKTRSNRLALLKNLANYFYQFGDLSSLL